MNEPKTDQAREDLLNILRRDAYFQEKIILSSGKESNYYIDARRVTLSARGAYLCAQVILSMIRSDHPDALGGPTMGADPLVGAIAAVSFAQGCPVDVFIIRKKPKAYGKQQQIEGPLFKENSRVILIDDVATTGKSLVESIDVLEKMSIRVSKALCLVDRGEGAREVLSGKGCELCSVFTLSDFRNS